MRQKDGESFYTIGEVADLVSVSSQTLRAWEGRGLLRPQRSKGGQRLFSESDLSTAKEIALLRRRHGWNAAAIKNSLELEPRPATIGPVALGARIRALRQSRDLTLAEVAERTGASRSFLAVLERGESGASVQMMSKIADALTVPMSAFAPPQHQGKLVLREQDRARTAVSEGVMWEELTTPGHVLEPALLIVASGASSGGAYSRPGETFAFMIAGELRFTLADSGEKLVLREGESMVLSPASTWSWHNAGPTEARAMWVEELPRSAWNRVPRVSGRNMAANDCRSESQIDPPPQTAR